MEGRKTEGVKHLERGAAADTDGGIHYQLARLYRENGDEESARKAIETFRTLREEQKRKIIDLTHPDRDSDLEGVAGR